MKKICHYGMWSQEERGVNESLHLHYSGGGAKFAAPPIVFLVLFMQPMECFRFKLLRITLKYKVITLSNILDNLKVAKFLSDLNLIC